MHSMCCNAYILIPLSVTAVSVTSIVFRCAAELTRVSFKCLRITHRRSLCQWFERSSRQVHTSKPHSKRGTASCKENRLKDQMSPCVLCAESVHANAAHAAAPASSATVEANSVHYYIALATDANYRTNVCEALRKHPTSCNTACNTKTPQHHISMWHGATATLPAALYIACCAERYSAPQQQT
jgi:hypothetical protein